MTTRKKLRKMARRRAAKARDRIARRDMSLMARSMARSLPANAFANMDDCLEEMWRMANDPVLSVHPDIKMAERILERAEHLTIPDLADMGVGDPNLNASVADTMISLFALGARHGIEATIWPCNAALLEASIPDFPDTMPEPLAKLFINVYWRGYYFFRDWDDADEGDETDDGDALILPEDFEDSCHDGY